MDCILKSLYVEVDSTAKRASAWGLRPMACGWFDIATGRSADFGTLPGPFWRKGHFTGHSFTVQSSDPEASVLPSGEKATALTAQV